jgi:hypothetical protein
MVYRPIVYRPTSRKESKMSSEVARLRQQIEAECQAMLHLAGFRQTGSHEIITAAYDRLGEHHDQLIKLVGHQKAAEVIVEALGGAE